MHTRNRIQGDYTGIVDVPDMVNNPPHYNQSEIECIDAIRAALTPEEFRGYIKGNVIKYMWREQKKNKDEDLGKAGWYLSKLLGILGVDGGQK
jgi:hypothetical protein